MADYPESYRYSKEHEWISLEDDVGTVGVTHHAQNELGDVVFLDLPEVGTRVTAGQPFGEIESVKAVSELFAPVSGEIAEVHNELVDQPELVNDDPHGQAWMVRIRLDDASEIDDLLSAEEYSTFVEEAD